MAEHPCLMTGYRTRFSAREPFAPAPLPQEQTTLSEAFSTHPADGAATGFVLAKLAGFTRPLIWISDRMSICETGEIYAPALTFPMLRIVLSQPADVLMAAEEALRCNALSAVVAEIWGNPKVLDFTATRRLAVRAEQAGMTCWLIRHGARSDLSAARERWRLSSLPAQDHPFDPKAPGEPRWHAELFRSRTARPGAWVARYDRTTHRLDLAAPFSDGTLHGAGEAPERRAAG